MTELQLVGTWQLVSYEVRGEDGASTRPFGEHPVGFLTYTADGYMTGQLGRVARAPIAGSDWEAATDAEIAAAARDYFAYCGTYSVSGDTVTHRVELSLLPTWIGGEQTRSLVLHGDLLTLSSSFASSDGAHMTAFLSWRRLNTGNERAT